MRTTFTSAETIRFRRAFATRNDRVGVPSSGAMAANFENKIREVGRVNLAMTRPVAPASITIPQINSATTSQFASGVPGRSSP